MSRAFVDEDASREDEVPEIPIPLPPGSRNYVTPEGARALRAELGRLLEERSPLVAGIARLEASSDSSDLDAAASLRRKLATADRRIEYLTRMSSLAEVVEPKGPGAERVTFGALVRIRDSSGTEISYRIVGVDESDPERGLLSWSSPLARALMGKGPGDSAILRLPAGERVLKIVDIA